MISFVSNPLSRQRIREYAFKVRKFFGVENKSYFPVTEIFEILPMAFEGLTCDIVEDTEFQAGIHAETDIQNHCIRIRQSVYDGACAGNGRDRMTIIHEIAHYLLLCVNGLKLQRNFSNNAVKAYCDPEWQAKCLAAEIMIPANIVKNMTVDEVVKNCGVLFEAASYQLTKIS
jgi:hypothetical protein